MVLDVRADCLAGEHFVIESLICLLSMLLFFVACCYCFKDLAEKVASTTLFELAEVRECLATAG